MKPSSTIYMGRTHTIDPTSLVAGDRVEVCLCDTSATCVWSYPATAREEGGVLRLEADDTELVNHRGAGALRPQDVDGCYTYLTKPWGRA